MTNRQQTTFQNILNMFQTYVDGTNSLISSTLKATTSHKEKYILNSKIFHPLLKNLKSTLLFLNRIPATLNIPIDSKSAFNSEIEKIGESAKKLIFENKIDLIYPETTSITCHTPNYDNSGTRDQLFIGNQFKGDIEGEGVWTNGKEIFKGDFSQGKKSGVGIYCYEDGTIFEGWWKDDKPDIGKWVLKDRKEFYGYYDRGKDFMLGFFLKEENELHEERKVFTELFYKRENVGISNLRFGKDLNLKKLKGNKTLVDPSSFHHVKVELEWLGGVR